jgi:hypothetical protein
VNDDDPYEIAIWRGRQTAMRRVLHPGWPTVAAMSQSTAQPPIVRYRNISMPASFEITISPAEPSDGADWAAVLLFLVDEGLERIDLRGALSVNVDTDQALDRAKAVRSISSWTQWALVRFALDVYEDQSETPATGQLQETWSQFASIAGYRSKRGRDRITNETLARVAQVYREAWAQGENPTAAVATAFDKARSTAATYVGLARKKGYLGPADSSRGGELPTNP